MLAPSSLPAPTPTRAIALLAVAGFASQAMVRSTDSLLPQIAGDFAVTVGAASVIVWAYALVHGSMQLVIGPIGDRFGKYRLIAIMCALCAVIVTASGFAYSLTSLTLMRIAAGATAAWIIPLGMAYIGDVVPYERRQQVLGRYLSGQITGQLFGQAAGGIIGDLLGWRAMFFVLGGILAVAAIGLFRELAVNPMTRPASTGERPWRGFVAEYSAVLVIPWARLIIFAVAIEATLMWGAFAYVGADLYARFGLNFTLVGLVVGAFGIGGLIYALTVKQLVARFGQTGLATWGGLILGAAFLLLALAPKWWIAPAAVMLIGLGFYMLHNTLQTNATQMAPEARASGIALFSAAIYCSQTVGVAVIAPIIDRVGAPPVFIVVGLLLPVLGLWLAKRIKAR